MPSSNPSSQQPNPASPAALRDNLLEQLGGKASSTGLLGQLSDSVKDIGTKAVARYRNFSTTQKVVGGVLLLLAVRQLTRGRKGHHKGPKKAHKAEAGTLHQLLQFVNDRVAGYTKAVEESQDPQRRSQYQRLVAQSQQFAESLNEHLRRLGGGHEASTTLKGKLYRRFMAAAALITGHDEATVLASNLHGEQWAIAAYEEALDDNTLRGPVRQEVERQYRQAQKTYQELKSLTA